MANQRTQITLGGKAMEAIRNTAKDYAKQGKDYGSFADRYAGADVQRGDKYLEPDAPAGIFGTASDVATRLAIASAREDEKVMAMVEEKAGARAAQKKAISQEIADATARLSEATGRVNTFDARAWQREANAEPARRASSAEWDASQKTARDTLRNRFKQVDVGTRANVNSVAAWMKQPIADDEETRATLRRVDTQQALAGVRTFGLIPHGVAVAKTLFKNRGKSKSLFESDLPAYESEVRKLRPLGWADRRFLPAVTDSDAEGLEDLFRVGK